VRTHCIAAEKNREENKGKTAFFHATITFQPSTKAQIPLINVFCLFLSIFEATNYHWAASPWYLIIFSDFLCFLRSLLPYFFVQASS